MEHKYSYFINLCFNISYYAFGNFETFDHTKQNKLPDGYRKSLLASCCSPTPGTCDVDAAILRVRINWYGRTTMGSPYYGQRVNNKNRRITDIKYDGRRTLSDRIFPSQGKNTRVSRKRKHRKCCSDSQLFSSYMEPMEIIYQTPSFFLQVNRFVWCQIKQCMYVLRYRYCISHCLRLRR